MPNEMIDPVKELRLRRWARENHVPVEHRSLDWHAVVLEEMCIRDEELLHNPEPKRRNSEYVPLAPGEIRVIHPAHNSIKEPKMLQERIRETESVDYF